MSSRRKAATDTHTFTHTAVQVTVGVSSAACMADAFRLCPLSMLPAGGRMSHTSTFIQGETQMTSCYHDNGWLGRPMWHEPTCWMTIKSPLLSFPLPLPEKQKRKTSQLSRRFFLLSSTITSSYSQLLCWLLLC